LSTAKGLGGEPKAGVVVTVVEHVQETSPAVEELALDEPILGDLEAPEAPALARRCESSARVHESHQTAQI